MSFDGFKTVEKGSKFWNRESISSIFKGTDLDDIKNEGFELVFNYLKVRF